MKKRWIKFFYDKALLAASMSRDKNTKVGAVIFDEEDKVELSSGYNCLPRGVKHSEERHTRPLKYTVMAHAEANAIANAAKLGIATNNKSLICSLYPCATCARLIINAGIRKLYTVPPDFLHEQYGKEFMISETMFKEAEIEIIYVKDGVVI